MLKPTLSLKISQQLTMTPQLQQAIRLLQLSSLDLEVEIRQAVERNPLLELVEEDEDEVAEAEPDPDIPDHPDANPDPVAEENDGPHDAEAALAMDTEPLLDPEDGEVTETWADDIPEDLPVDSDWDSLYETTGVTGVASPVVVADDDSEFETGNAPPETLTDQLIWQLNLTTLSDTDRLIGIAIIDAIDGDGFLRASFTDIRECLEPDLHVDLSEVESVLHLIQQFDPPGVAARDLRESLLLQLAQLAEETPLLTAARQVVEEHLDLLAARDYTQLMRRSKLDSTALRDVIDLIRSLHARPGTLIGDPGTDYVTEDVIVSRDNGRWQVRLNPEIEPRVRVNPFYASLVKRGDNGSDNTFLRENLQEARWFIKSLRSRAETLLKVATCIVEHQRGFLEYGPEAMKPLVLHDIAEAVDMHESTISRVTTRKYMRTPRGIYELKYFFSSHVETASGGEVSSVAIKEIIKKLTAEESPAKPLSDSKIAALLAEQDIKVARRTVAKYREALAIPPSNERKQLV